LLLYLHDKRLGFTTGGRRRVSSRGLGYNIIYYYFRSRQYRRIGRPPQWVQCVHIHPYTYNTHPVCFVFAFERVCVCVCVRVCTCDKHLIKYSRGANDVDDEGLLDLIGSKVKINLTPTFAAGNLISGVRGRGCLSIKRILIWCTPPHVWDIILI